MMTMRTEALVGVDLIGACEERPQTIALFVHKQELCMNMGSVAG